MNGLPLSGVKVLDLSTLLPGPLATLMLADAGADVVKLERPGGDEMRHYHPRIGEASANYAFLNRSKRAYAVDLKDPAQRDHVLTISVDADIVVEQFRPGVIDRLGLGYEQIIAVDPDIIYCSITGYDATGLAAQHAGHDLNYLAECGLLGAVVDDTGSPSLPVSVIADIAGGSYPAVVNILLALRQRDGTGEGTHLQVAMVNNLHVLAYGYFATRQADGGWLRPGAGLLIGGSPRYHLYRTADKRYVACAALEQKFWDRLVELIGLDERFRSDAGQEQLVIAALAQLFASNTAVHWRALSSGEVVCASVVATWGEAEAAGLVEVDAPEHVATPSGDRWVPTLPSPIAPALRHLPATKKYPVLADLGAESLWA